LTAIDNVDLNLFDFDYDLTMMIFFLNAEGRVYARYCGRDGRDADNRQSLAGLLYTMNSVLEMHQSGGKSFAPRRQETTRIPREIPRPKGFNRGGCLHCHEVKPLLEPGLWKPGGWTHDMVYRFPLPDNLGFILDVDRSNVIREVKEKTPAAAAGLQPGDIVRRLAGVPIHSLGDAQFALDRSPRTGSIDITWQRGETLTDGKLELFEGWKKGDVSWRASVRNLVPYVRLYGTDLTPSEKKALGLSPAQLAFRQQEGVPKQARDAGIQAGDIIVGIDDRMLETDVNGFIRHVQSNYLMGDRATINVFRDGQRLRLTMTFVP
jgi:membrane-associated protease RseP (regulator of RpoE activity)